ncbi:MAG: hypothetical protein IKM20_09865 [Erysipelotrichales bacterium]|nr:hypothetical protein [Erysipelotrichales bacterium]
MKFKLIACAIILSCTFTVGYFYVFTSFLRVPITVSSELNKTIYYNQIGCFKNPDMMMNILDTNNIEYITYVDNEFTYFISGISSDMKVTKENEVLLNSKSIDSLSKAITLGSSGSKLEKSILEYLE